jgi:aminoglycoside 3'-phosphotransferase-1
VALVDGCAWARNRIGASGAAVYRLRRPGVADLYLKHGQGVAAADVQEEASRLRWLGRHVPVPDVLGCVSASHETWLLMSALPGRTAWQVLRSDVQHHAVVVDALARFLRRLHAAPVQDRPFDSGHRVRLARARVQVEAGLVDVDDFDEERRGWSAAQVLEQTMALLPLPTDAVVTR